MSDDGSDRSAISDGLGVPESPPDPERAEHVLPDADAHPVGARGCRGFIPFAMLTGDRDPESFRCYNWIDDPADCTDGDVAAGDTDAEHDEG